MYTRMLDATHAIWRAAGHLCSSLKLLNTYFAYSGGAHGRTAISYVDGGYVRAHANGSNGARQRPTVPAIE